MRLDLHVEDGWVMAVKHFVDDRKALACGSEAGVASQGDMRRFKSPSGHASILSENAYRELEWLRCENRPDHHAELSGPTT